MKQLIARLSAKWVEKKPLPILSNPLEKQNLHEKWPGLLLRNGTKKVRETSRKVSETAVRVSSFSFGFGSRLTVGPIGYNFHKCSTNQIELPDFSHSSQAVNTSRFEREMNGRKKVINKSRCSIEWTAISQKKTPLISLSSGISFPRWTMYR